MTHAVASRYVTALADVVMEAETGIAPEEALEQLQAFGTVLEESGELVTVLTSPAVLPGEKGDLIAEIGERIELAPIVRSFLQVVVEHRRIAHYGMLVQGFRSWLDTYRNRVEIQVRVASEIAERFRFQRRPWNGDSEGSQASESGPPTLSTLTCSAALPCKSARLSTTARCARPSEG